MENSVRTIAFYLPQFHPIPENDEWWGRGFTEWTNTAKAKALFPGHYQPHVPGDLGFYDLRVPETRIAQAELAQEYGIEGFCYYHYWFGGKRLLERPFNEVLKTGEPDFPFCLCWANETWSGKWHGYPEKILIQQSYPGIEDEKAHFDFLINAFRDKRYIKVNGRPMFLVYQPMLLPNPRTTLEHWRELAHKAGIEGLYFIGIANEPWEHAEHGFDAKMVIRSFHAEALGEMKGTRKIRRYLRKMLGFPQNIHSYKRIYKHFLVDEAKKEHIHPCVIPNWDNSPRCGANGTIFHDSSPDLFRKHLRAVLQQISIKQKETRIVFIKSWNEWAEGNHMEPDLKYGRGYLQVVKEEIEKLQRYKSE
jgi:lipopolysaccharide biosynthesis protein